MRNYVFSLLLLILFTNISCSRNNEDSIENIGVKSSLSGIVKNETTGLPVENYKIKFSKWKNICANWACGLSSTEIKTVLTDKNGYYKIDFFYKLEPGESYGLEEQYYGFPYKPEYQPSKGILAGTDNILNINVWEPIKIKINTEVRNNFITPVIIGNRVAKSESYLFNVENFYENQVSRTVTLYTKPKSDIILDIWYNENYNNPNSIRHLKSQSLTTGTSDIDINLQIDCSTF